MRKTRFWLPAMAVALLVAGNAVAADFRNRQPWDYNVRANVMALTRASMMWQAQRAAAVDDATTVTDTGDAGTASTLAATGASAAWLPQISSVANMNIVTVMVGEGGVADVAVEAEQQNQGGIDATGILGSTMTTNSLPGGP